MRLIGASRVRGIPLSSVVAGSRVVPCANCKADLWVSPSSQALLAEDDVQAMCLFACFRIKTMEMRSSPDGEGMEWGVAPGAEAELQETLGDQGVVDVRAFLMGLNERERHED
jgi:hypothetical protein